MVVKFSRSRHRYERQGLLLEPEALIRAEKECEGDEADRKISRESAAVVPEHADKEYIAQLSKQIRLQYPGCPGQETEAIADHACQKHRTSRKSSYSPKTYKLRSTSIERMGANRSQVGCH